MLLTVQINRRSYKIETDTAIDISIPLKFNEAQPNAYGVERAAAKPCEVGTLVGDTRRGGSCNFEQVTLIPHCNGTHTECVGHLTDERISVQDCLQDAFIPSTLLSVKPESVNQTQENYPFELNRDDKLITRKSLEDELRKFSNGNFQSEFLRGLIVRARPNDENKLTQIYLEKIPPFFSTEAMEFIVASGVRHLLVDLPSIDRLFDGGRLSNHRIFWNVEQGSFATNKASRINSTITELIFAADKIEDGHYLLNLQIAPFAADAAPSRPMLFKLSS